MKRFTIYSFSGFMVEIARKFEELAKQYNPSALVGIGILCVLVGLFLWLGGLEFRKILVAVIGASLAGFIAWNVSNHQLIWTIISAVAGAVIGRIFEKILITLFAAVLAAVAGFIILNNTQLATFENLRKILTQTALYSWITMAVLVIVFLAAGIFLWRITAAFFYAALGAVLIYAGMFLLLVFKGSSPAEFVGKQPAFYTMIFAFMAAFGTVEQLLLCRLIKKGTKKQTGEQKDEQKEDKKKRRFWRSE